MTASDSLAMLLESKKIIKEGFHYSLDPSRVVQALGESDRLERVGAGYHFTSYRLDLSGFSYCLSLSRPRFHEGTSVDLDNWMKAMKQLQSLDNPLIPPMLHGTHEGKAYYLSPYCPQNFSQGKSVINPWLANLKQDLADQGLMVDDYWQVRCFHQHPFVIDWSDLKFTRP